MTRHLRPTLLAASLALAVGCAGGSGPSFRANPPMPDPRIGLAPGLFDAGEAIWNLQMLSTTPPPEEFVGSSNSDLAFTGNYAIQGNYDGVQVWDISDPRNPVSVVTYVCPASQSDVSVYENLLFVSGEGFGGRLDCSGEGVEEAVSHDRLRGIRIFDISDIANPEYVANVQTCRGSHTHTVLKHPGDDDNVYIYVSGSAPVRPAEEMAGCSGLSPDEDPNSALFRIEVIRVPLDNPQAAAIASSPRIFEDLVAPPVHGLSPADIAEVEAARARGAFVVEFGGEAQVLPDQIAAQLLAQAVQQRGGQGDPTAADSAAVRTMIEQMVAAQQQGGGDDEGPAPGPSQCHDITVYPHIGLAGGACGGYGLLLDITDPVNPTRLAAVADSNFSYWHSATFNNDGSTVMFTDEWGGGGAPKCRADDPMEWGANAIFTVEDGDMVFQSYFKLPAHQTSQENCVAHNGSLIPIPGRDIMIQGWYQGGISLIDWTDPTNPFEIAYHDRGPVDGETMVMGGSWSVYWYNGLIVNSEIARGLDIFALTPSELLTQNEIDAANSVVLSQLNSQGQPVFEWPATFALARAYLDQLERWNGLSGDRIASARSDLAAAEGMSGSGQGDALRGLAAQLRAAGAGAGDPDKVGDLAEAVERLASQASMPMAPAGAAFSQAPGLNVNPPTPDPRVGLAPGLFDAEEAIWNLRMISTTPPEAPFVGRTNSDLAFTGNYAIQGNYDGVQVWDISDPRQPVSVITYVCPASQSDVSVYDNLLFVSGEGLGGRLDCGDEGVQEAVSHDRLRGIRIFDITDIANPEYVANVQTCRGSHTHTVLKHPGDDDNVYIYVSGSSSVRPPEELAGCSGLSPDEDPNSALFRIEAIRVPLDDPASAAIVSSPRIFHDLVAPPVHGLSPADYEEIEAARARGDIVGYRRGQPRVLRDRQVQPMLDSIVAARGGTGEATAEDRAALQAALDDQGRIQAERAAEQGDEPRPGPTQCHDITVYPAIGLAGGACGGYGLLLDITDPANPTRLAAVADSNFSYWHSATFNNDGTTVMFTDEWGGGGAPKCRASDPMEWGANAIFTIEDGDMVFQSYYKMPAPQTTLENCVAHNGSLIPIPGRDIMIQGWYQGGISLIDWTDPANPVEIGFHDRGPSDGTRQGAGGSWSVYWYNGVIVNSEISRGLDIFELVPSEAITQNEIDAANSVVLTQLNSQGQPIFEWPATFALARAYLDQLERWHGMTAQQIADARQALENAETLSGADRRYTLRSLASTLEGAMGGASDQDKVGDLVDAVSRLAAM